MSFTSFAGSPLRTREQIAREVHAVSRRRGLTEVATIIALMTISTEVGAADGDGNRQWWCPSNPTNDPDSDGFPHDSTSNDSRSSGYFQQQPGPNGEAWWGTANQRMTLEAAADMFLDRLSNDYVNARDAHSAGVFAQLVQGSSFPDRYREKWEEAHEVLGRALAGDAGPTPRPDAGWAGDPVWLEEVLRPVLGDKLKTLPGWEESGVGDFGDIWGVMWHHTGNSRESAQSIRNGRPDLRGPLANLHIGPDGTVTIVAVGVCNHSGRGSGFGLPDNAANNRLIGVECAWPTIGPDGGYSRDERWPDAQIIAMRDVAAALTTRLGYGAERNIGHKEWAGSAQGKWDPGNISMDWFRAEVAKAMRGEFTSTEPEIVPPSPSKPPVLPKPSNPRSDRELLEDIWDQLRGPLGNGWSQLGDKTLIDYLASLGEYVSILESRLAALSAALPVKRPPAKPQKKPPAKKAPAKKAVAKKTPAKKTPAKKTPAKKAVAKKTPATRAIAKKTPATRAVAKKTPVRKSTARKSTARKVKVAAS